MALAAMVEEEKAKAAVPDPLAAKQPHHAPTAKSVIFLFMEGGPSHVDLFDYKPALINMDGQPIPDSIGKPKLTAQANVVYGKTHVSCEDALLENQVNFIAYLVFQNLTQAPIRPRFMFNPVSAFEWLGLQTVSPPRGGHGLKQSTRLSTLGSIPKFVISPFWGPSGLSLEALPTRFHRALSANSHPTVSPALCTHPIPDPRKTRRSIP
jgi:hypothetical protein